MKKIALPLALLLSGCATAPAAVEIAQAPAFTTSPLPAQIPSDLPRNARPLHYRIHVVPDMEKLAFSGTTSIDLELFEPSRAITLHANELAVSDARLFRADGSGEAIPLEVSLDSELQIARLAAARPLAPGAWRLDLTYSGRISTQATGLFALDYPDKTSGEEVRALFTQFEAPDARRFTPLFDEPSYKATFDLKATVPAELMAVSNMPVAGEIALGDGTKEVTFATSPKMSSYLLFFGLGDFERMAVMAGDRTEVGIVSPTGSGEQARYALESMALLMPYFRDYFGVGYDLPKLDNIAGPGSSQFFGAMENWGAIFTFERILLLDPAITSAGTRQNIFSVQAHEVAHQWFGDRVTMAWWDDLWLNEGFASWMETKATDHFNPDWDRLLTRVGGRERAMNLDAFATTHPVVQEIRTVNQLGEAFDAITYQKGEAVIAMFEAYAGEDVWRSGLRAYMQEHAFANTASSDLWRAIETAGAPGLQAIAQEFTTQPGVPLVRVSDVRCAAGRTELSLVQSEFSRDRTQRSLDKPQRWTVPLRIRIGAGEGTSHLLEGSADLALEGCGPVIVNGGQLGYFRTLYEPNARAEIVAGFASLQPIDQYGLMRDNMALSLAGLQPMSAGLDMLAAVPPDASGVLARDAVERWLGLYKDLRAEDGKARLASLVARDWLPRLRELGFEAKADEPILDSRLRETLIGAFGTMGNAEVVAEAARLFALMEADPAALDGPLKTVWLGVIAENANREQWDLMQRLAGGSSSAVERDVFYSALGKNRDEALAKAALELALTDEPGPTTSADIIAAVSALHPELAWDFADANRDRVDTYLDSSGKAGFYAGLFGGADSEGMLAKAKAYRDSLSQDRRASVNRSIAAIQARLDDGPRQRAGLMEWLAAR